MFAVAFRTGRSVLVALEVAAGPATTASWSGGEARRALVRDLGREAVLPVGRVAHYLRAPVRQLDSVLAARHVAVADGVVRVVVAVRVLLHRIVEVERHSRHVNVAVVVLKINETSLLLPAE